jgi:hypothetical protein
MEVGCQLHASPASPPELEVISLQEYCLEYTGCVKNCVIVVVIIIIIIIVVIWKLSNTTD